MCSTQIRVCSTSDECPAGACNHDVIFHDTETCIYCEKEDAWLTCTECSVGYCSVCDCPGANQPDTEETANGLCINPPVSRTPEKSKLGADSRPSVKVPVKGYERREIEGKLL
eukprot:IDg10023t1